MSRKVFVLDTSAIMSLVQDVTTFRDPRLPAFAGVLGDNEIIIPQIVLDELQELRNASGDKATIALEAARQIEHYSVQGSLIDGVETEKGGLIRIEPKITNEKIRAWGLDPYKEDHHILATAMELEDALKVRQQSSGEENGIPSKVILITQDQILRVLCRSVYSVRAEELKSVCAPELEKDIGYKRIELSSDEIDIAIQEGEYDLSNNESLSQFYHLVDKENPDIHYSYGFARDSTQSKMEMIDRSKVDYLKIAGEVTGRNVQQKLLLWALMGCGEPDPMAKDGVRLITVSGPAGSGKSFLTIAAAWERLERGHFDRIVVTRPMVEVGTSLGYLPGTLEEKIEPWGGPIEDNLRAIVQVPNDDESKGSKRGVQRSVRPFDAKSWLEMENRLELIPLTYIRGRTFRRSFVILEEAQNIERGPLKVLLTRLGEGSVVVVLGDTSQIDNQFLSRRNNGLVHAINAFRSWPQAVHVQLKEVVRSDLAEAASTLL